jgi:N-acetylneuraminic acid mutarotase
MKGMIGIIVLALAGLTVGCSPKTEVGNPPPTDPQNWEWQRVADFGGQAQRGSMAFAIDNAAYVVSGMGNSFVPHHECWKYDSGADSWTQKAAFPGTAIIEGVGFAIGSKGYIGLGSTNGPSGAVDSLWEYDPTEDRWIPRAAFPGPHRSGAVALVIGPKAYIVAGSSDQGHARDVWEYDPAADQWTPKADFPGAGRFLPAAFVIGTRGYLGTGMLGGPPFLSATDFWEYDPVADLWTRKAEFPGAARGYSLGFSINGRGVLGLGMTYIDPAGAVMTLVRDLWEYLPATDTWTARPDFTGTPRTMTIGFTIGTSLYIGGGNDAGGMNLRDFWRMRPGQ